jgi:hypothetical protein
METPNFISKSTVTLCNDALLKFHNTLSISWQFDYCLNFILLGPTMKLNLILKAAIEQYQTLHF